MFLGPNGAGKTTTIKLLCGMLTPLGGSCKVFDIDPTKNPEKLHQMSGVLTEHAQMYDHLSGIENFISRSFVPWLVLNKIMPAFF